MTSMHFSPHTITSHDPWQDGYTYTCIEPEGENFAEEFSPDLTPAEMLALGVFGGAYLVDLSEFPEQWFIDAKLSQAFDASQNFFKIEASQSYEIWKAKGWIYPEDPRGWFQWYCRYYMGRRIQLEDARQIKRWKAMRRHIAQIKLNCKPGDIACRPRQRQALLQWAYDTRSI